MGTRQRSQLPIKDSRKSFSKPANKGKINNLEVPQDQEILSTGKGSKRDQAHFAPHLRDPLTPLHRLRRFKEIRDKNLRKISLRKKRFDGNKMSVDIEKEESDGNRSGKEVKTVKDKPEKITNGTQENGENHPEEIVEVEKKVEGNGEVKKRSPEKSVTEKLEVVGVKEVKDQVITESFEKEVIKVNEEVKIDDISDDEEVEVLKVDTEEDNDNRRERDDESSNEEQQSDDLKVLRCSFKGEINRHSPQPSTSTSQQDLSYLETQSTSSEQSHVLEKQSSLSPETVERFKSFKVEGRRSLYQHYKAGYRKRKYDDNYEYGSVISEKKQALRTGGELKNTPSVSSPGWKFISSPFSRFWTPHNTPAPGYTPYKSISLTTPYHDDNEDSLAVNFDDKSLYGNLNDSELGLPVDSTQSTTNNGWRCNLM